MTHRPFRLPLVAGPSALGLRVAGLLAASLVVAVCVPARAQSPWPSQPESQAQVQDRWPAPTQQMEQRAPEATGAPASEPAAKPRPARKPKPKPAPAAEGDPAAAPAAAPRAAARAGAKPAAGAPKAIACSGVFAKSSTHLALATAFDAKNVDFTEVDGPEGSKLNASVLFPTEPKRRLEVLWQNEAARSDIALIVITGQSAWTGPKGLKLGLGLAQLEKINGKPFKLSGFDQDNGGSVVDWQGGALDALPGGCKVGIRLVPDAKATDAAKAQAAGKEFVSTDAAVKGVKPSVAEILFGYPQQQ
ncbi:hypothetical protein J2S22_001014 [Rhodoplanes tepidamans]|uniref:Uncharacterized protein n=3 Tax=Rhodoplanes TaxID=29407 RepID=A0ABT5J9W4_RHOTP|nr:hypothetical protein [Rhodoplanes tepidamans]MDC7786353.1 hypothetical protein [Rhodoplanes tepidamans]MDQ0354097.1 hypothetical protein [Rhodoplanes tepidamans]